MEPEKISTYFELLSEQFWGSMVVFWGVCVWTNLSGSHKNDYILLTEEILHQVGCIKPCK